MDKALSGYRRLPSGNGQEKIQDRDFLGSYDKYHHDPESLPERVHADLSEMFGGCRPGVLNTTQQKLLDDYKETRAEALHELCGLAANFAA